LQVASSFTLHLTYRLHDVEFTHDPAAAAIAAMPCPRSWRSSFFNYFYFTINIGRLPITACADLIQSSQHTYAAAAGAGAGFRPATPKWLLRQLPLLILADLQDK
jgi:hypothetical protein